MGMPRNTPYFSMACRVYREQLGVYLHDAGSMGVKYRRYTRINPMLAFLINNASFASNLPTLVRAAYLAQRPDKLLAELLERRRGRRRSSRRPRGRGSRGSARWPNERPL